jgi:hypothetical protein
MGTWGGSAPLPTFEPPLVIVSGYATSLNDREKSHQILILPNLCLSCCLVSNDETMQNKIMNYIIFICFSLWQCQQYGARLISFVKNRTSSAFVRNQGEETLKDLFETCFRKHTTYLFINESHWSTMFLWNAKRQIN